MIELLAFIYYFVSGISSIPAIVRICRRKSSEDVSTVTMVLSCVGEFSWCAYTHLTLQSMVTRAGAVISVVIILIWTIVVFKYHGRE